jgi:hypothetical protein
MYIIPGHHEVSGTYNDDSGDLTKYYELGWECVISNIQIKNLLDLGKISKADIIVTKEDRKFIYSSVFDNVIDYQSFKELNVDENEIMVIDHFDALETLDFTKVNKELMCDFDLIDDIEETYNITENFICYCYRLRNHCEYRNSSVIESKRTINKIVNELGMKVFVVGHDAESLCDGENVIHVGLREFASLINSKYCKCCISKLSGIIHLANFCGHKDLINIIYDPTMDREKAGEHPLYMGDNINYKDTTNIFVQSSESDILTLNLINEYVL